MARQFTQFLEAVRNNLLVTISMVCLLVFGAAGFYLHGFQDELTSDLREAEKQGTNIIAAIAGQARLSAAIQSATGAVAHLDANVAVENDLAANLAYFYQFETGTGVRLVSVNQLSSPPLVAGNRYSALPFTLQLTGSYPQVLNYLRALEHGPRVSRIRSFNLSREGATLDAQPGKPIPEILSIDLTIELLSIP